MGLISEILKKYSAPEYFKGEGITTYLNPYSYLIARKNMDVYRQFDSLRVDGWALVLLLRIFNRRLVRESFDMTSMAPEVFSQCQSSDKSLFLIGSTSENIQAMQEKLKLSYPELNVVGARNGYFASESQRVGALVEIAATKPDVVVVGMGAPMQEEFLLDLKKQGWRGAGYTCGGFFHQTASSQGMDYYPAFFDKFNIRWIYRIYDEPKLFKRYFFFYPLFLLVFLWDALRHSIRH